MTVYCENIVVQLRSYLDELSEKEEGSRSEIRDRVLPLSLSLPARREVTPTLADGLAVPKVGPTAFANARGKVPAGGPLWKI